MSINLKKKVFEIYQKHFEKNKAYVVLFLDMDTEISQNIRQVYSKQMNQISTSLEQNCKQGIYLKNEVNPPKIRGKFSLFWFGNMGRRLVSPRLQCINQIPKTSLPL